jgi:hypothetical protein
MDQYFSDSFVGARAESAVKMRRSLQAELTDILGEIGFA